MIQKVHVLEIVRKNKIMTRKYRSFADVEKEYFINHPEEIVDYIKILLEEFDKDGNIETLLSSLRRISLMEE